MSIILYTETKYLKILISLANEEDEVPYYTGRKDLADIEDATVDTDDSEKTLIKRYGFSAMTQLFAFPMFFFKFFVMESQTIVKGSVGVARSC